MWYNFKFEGVLFRSDSRQNNRVDECRTESHRTKSWHILHGWNIWHSTTIIQADIHHQNSLQHHTHHCRLLSPSEESTSRLPGTFPDHSWQVRGTRSQPQRHQSSIRLRRRLLRAINAVFGRQVEHQGCTNISCDFLSARVKNIDCDFLSWVFCLFVLWLSVHLPS